MKARDPIDYARLKMRRDSTFSPLVLLNLAGRHLTTMHGWKWLHRTSNFTLTSGQNYVALPSDCERVVAVKGNDALDGIAPVSPDELLAYRQNSGVIAGNYRYAVSYRDLGAANPTMVLELDEAPTATEADWGVVWYVSGWQEITSEEDEVELPSFMEPLFYLLFDQWLFGSEEHDVAPLSARLESITRGSVFMAAKRHDEAHQEAFGPITGGAARALNFVDGTTLNDFTVADPV